MLIIIVIYVSGEKMLFLMKDGYILKAAALLANG